MTDAQIVEYANIALAIMVPAIAVAIIIVLKKGI